MNANQFIEKFGREEGAAVARLAGTNFVYLQQIAKHHRRPSPALAKQLEEASGGRMTREALRPDIWSAA